MATTENKGLLSYKDTAGNLHLLYPVTQTDLVDGLTDALAAKVDKVSGKGLSANDFTAAYKSKLDGIAAGANKYVLPSGGVGTSHLASAAVTAAKIAGGAVSQSLTVTLSAGGWSGKTQTVTASGVTASNTVLVTPAPASFLAYAEAQVRCTAQAANSLTFQCEEVPAAALTVQVCCINK